MKKYVVIQKCVSDDDDLGVVVAERGTKEEAVEEMCRIYDEEMTPYEANVVFDLYVAEIIC